MGWWKLQHLIPNSDPVWRMVADLAGNLGRCEAKRFCASSQVLPHIGAVRRNCGPVGLVSNGPLPWQNAEGIMYVNPGNVRALDIYV